MTNYSKTTTNPIHKPTRRIVESASPELPSDPPIAFEAFDQLPDDGPPPPGTPQLPIDDAYFPQQPPQPIGDSPSPAIQITTVTTTHRRPASIPPIRTIKLAPPPPLPPPPPPPPPPQPPSLDTDKREITRLKDELARARRLLEADKLEFQRLLRAQQTQKAQQRDREQRAELEALKEALAKAEQERVAQQTLSADQCARLQAQLDDRQRELVAAQSRAQSADLAQESLRMEVMSRAAQDGATQNVLETLSKQLMAVKARLAQAAQRNATDEVSICGSTAGTGCVTRGSGQPRFMCFVLTNLPPPYRQISKFRDLLAFIEKSQQRARTAGAVLQGSASRVGRVEEAIRALTAAQVEAVRKDTAAAECRRQLAQRDEELRSAREQLEKLQADATQASAIAKQQADVATQREAQLNALCGELRNLVGEQKAQLVQQTGRTKQLLLERDQARAEAMDLQQRLQGCQEAADAQSKGKVLAHANESAQAVARLQERIQALEGELDRTHTEAARLRTALHDAQVAAETELSESGKRHDQLQAEVTHAKAELAQEAEHRRVKEIMLDEQNEAMRKLKSTHAETERQLEIERKAREAAEADCVRLREDRDEARSTVVARDEVAQFLQPTPAAQRLEEEIDEGRRLRQDLEDRAAALEQECATLKKATRLTRTLEPELTAMRRAVETQEKRHAEQLGAVRRACDQLHNRSTALQHQLDQATSDCVAAQGRAKALEEQLQVRVEECQRQALQTTRAEELLTDRNGQLSAAQAKVRSGTSWVSTETEVVIPHLMCTVYHHTFIQPRLHFAILQVVALEMQLQSTQGEARALSQERDNLRGRLSALMAAFHAVAGVSCNADRTYLSRTLSSPFAATGITTATSPPGPPHNRLRNLVAKEFDDMARSHPAHTFSSSSPSANFVSYSTANSGEPRCFPNSLSIHTVKDQVVSECGSCWAHACAGMAGDRLYRVTNGTFNKVMSPQTLMDCDHSCHENATAAGFYCDDGCNGGLLELATQFMVDYGMLTDECITYKCTTPTTCDPLCDDRKTTRVPIPARQAAWCPGEQNIMQEIYLHGTVAVVMVFYEDFQYYQSGIYQHVYGTDFGGHVVSLIGWGEEDGIKYWIARNSESPQWGENARHTLIHHRLPLAVSLARPCAAGFFRIRRGTNVARIEEDSWVVYYDPPAIADALAANGRRSPRKGRLPRPGWLLRLFLCVWLLCPRPCPCRRISIATPPAAGLLLQRSAGRGPTTTGPSWAMLRCLADGAPSRPPVRRARGVSNHCPMVDWPACVLQSVSMSTSTPQDIHTPGHPTPRTSTPQDILHASLDYNIYTMHQEMFNNPGAGWPHTDCFDAATRYACAGLTTVCMGLPDEPDVDCTMVDPVPYTPTQYGTDGKCPQGCLDLRLAANRAQLGICGEPDTLPAWNYTCALNVTDQARFAMNAFQEWTSLSGIPCAPCLPATVVNGPLRQWTVLPAFRLVHERALATRLPPLIGTGGAVRGVVGGPIGSRLELGLRDGRHGYSTCTAAMDRCNLGPSEASWCLTYQRNSDGECTGYPTPLDLPTVTPIVLPGVPAWAAYLIGFLPAAGCLAVGLLVGLLVGRRLRPRVRFPTDATTSSMIEAEAHRGSALGRAENALAAPEGSATVPGGQVHNQLAETRTPAAVAA
ncbi:putative Cathepsin B [Paratrimastix pyriformis]|uniref:Cathepsin B n=1 Tax=Paratrimastix pyriformis TaxID=342808 RepID=A0ABQ8UDW1_9EUKA|nr:putative Cathepsin B [Paratrimastix pyriformis]